MLRSEWFWLAETIDVKICIENSLNIWKEQSIEIDISDKIFFSLTTADEHLTTSNSSSEINWWEVATAVNYYNWKSIHTNKH